jgi:hypothetical protein
MLTDGFIQEQNKQDISFCNDFLKQPDKITPTRMPVADAKPDENIFTRRRGCLVKANS